jgi:DNA-directed RNA polymerase subunit RPC12/RpoP
VILAIALALLQCPQCGRRGFGASSNGKACRYCGFAQAAAP